MRHVVGLWLAACGAEAPPPGPSTPVQHGVDAPVAELPPALRPAVLDARPLVHDHAATGPCGDCHSEQAAAWAGSPHDLALGAAERAMGRFDGQPVTLPGLTATPALDGADRSLTVTDGAGTRRYAVRHTFGHDPLQQLLLQGDDGALLVAPIAWDVAGERWYDPAPDGVAADPDDPLYWAGLFGTWNHMCATCHSTGVVEGFQAETGTYVTTSTHEDVACAACHGEGPTVQTLHSGAAQLDTCGSCHSLRGPLAPGWTPGSSLLDHFTPALLDNPVYAADGGLQDDQEAFVWGSFQQSRMAAAGVRCTHCHAPHGTGLVAQGEALCTTCHDARFAAGGHDAGRACVDCHMPQRRYMGLDLRRDHSFPVPGRAAGLPAGVVAAARQGDPSAAPALLAAVQDQALSEFHRASALALLKGQPPGTLSPVYAALSDESGLVRWQATEVMAVWGHAAGLWPQLQDPVRAVRFAAAKALVVSGPTPPSETWRTLLSGVLAELQVSLAAEGDEPASHVNLAVLQSLEGDLEGALDSARTAVRLAPAFPGAQQMLATLEAQAAPQ